MREVGKDTKMLSVVSVDATKSKIVPLLNLLFEVNDIDAIATVMSVRDEDFNFFISNVNSSKIFALEIERDFRERVKEILNLDNSVDSIDIRDGELNCYSTQDRAILNLIGDKFENIAIVGLNSDSKSFIETLKNSQEVKSISIFGDSPENSKEFIDSLNFQDRRGFEIERFSENRDFSKYSVVINFDLTKELKTQNSINLNDIKLLFQKLKIDFKRWFDIDIDELKNFEAILSS